MNTDHTRLAAFRTLVAAQCLAGGDDLAAALEAAAAEMDAGSDRYASRVFEVAIPRTMLAVVNRAALRLHRNNFGNGPGTGFNLFFSVWNTAHEDDSLSTRVGSVVEDSGAWRSDIHPDVAVPPAQDR
jgi:hypothetical protein